MMANMQFTFHYNQTLYALPTFMVRERVWLTRLDVIGGGGGGEGGSVTNALYVSSDSNMHSLAYHCVISDTMETRI